MPTAVASFDDFDLDEPARKRPPRSRASRPKGKSAPRKKGRRPRFAIDMQRAVRWGAIGMSGTLALAIMVNALVLQKGHHPAPLFGKAIVLGPSPAPAAKPISAERIAPEAPVAAPPAPAPDPRQTETTNYSGNGDPIGQLITGKAAAVAPKLENRTVMGAQRALAKLGFPLKPNGTLGPQTRKAIESFERDRHMPVNGELSHRLLRILAAESGTKIEQ